MTLPYSGMFDEEASRLALASTNTPLVVTTVDDIVDASDGVLSLREAVTLANETQGLDTITFSDDVMGRTVHLTESEGNHSDGIRITDDIIINGGEPGTTIQTDFGDLIDSSLILIFDGVDAYTQNLNLTNDNSSRGASAISSRDSNVVMEHSDINVHNQYSSGISVFGGKFTLIDSIVDASGDSPTGIGVSGGKFTLIDSIVDTSGEGPGSIRTFNDAVFHIIDSEISGFTPYSGAYPIGGSGSMFITGSTIDAFGSYRSLGIEFSGQLEISNSTILSVSKDSTGNGDPGDRAIRLYGGEGVLDHVTILGPDEPVYNVPGEGWDFIALETLGDARLTLQNSIIAGKYDTSTGKGDITDGGGNVLSDRDGVSFYDVFATGELADNGGPTPTLALLDDPSNPAIGAAIPSGGDEVDQRGFTRDAAPDAGAFEAGAGTPPLIPLPELHEKVAVAEDDINGIVNSSFIIGKDGDAVITFLDEYAGYQNTLGVYLVGTRSTISDVRIVFDRIEHAQASDEASASARPGGGPLDTGDSVALSELYDEGELHEGTQFGLFLISDGASRNDASVFHSGHLEFRDGDDAATMSSYYRPPELVHVADDGSETTVAGPIMHVGQAGTTRYGNGLNPDRGVQTISGLYDPENRLLAIEDKPVAQSDADFNDLIISVDLAPDSGTLIA